MDCAVAFVLLYSQCAPTYGCTLARYAPGAMPGGTLKCLNGLARRGCDRRRNDPGTKRRVASDELQAFAEALEKLETFKTLLNTFKHV